MACFEEQKPALIQPSAVAEWSNRLRTKSQFSRPGEKQRLFTAFDYAAGSWRRLRRVIARAGHPAKGSNPRFIVTNIVGDPQQLHDRRHCACGGMEKRIKERMMLFAERRGDRAPGHPRSPPPGLPPSLSRDLPARPGVSRSVDLVYYSAHKSRMKQFLLGLLALLLIGVVDAVEESAELGDVIKKAEQGDAKAQFNLAVMYSKGSGRHTG